MNSCATRRLRIAFGVLLPLLVAAGIGAAGPDEEPIRIGVAGPMDGDQGKMGQDILNGVRLAMDECNRGGGSSAGLWKSSRGTTSMIRGRRGKWRTVSSTPVSSA